MLVALRNIAVVSRPKADEDLALVELARQGDQLAVERLYVRHHGRIYAMAHRLTGNRSDAEDVVQEAFLKAWRALDRFRGEATFGTWLFRIAINLCRDWAKRRKPTEQEVDGVAPTVRSDGIARRRLAAALRQLSEGYREVLVLHDVMELKHPEIAAILGVGVGTSKSQLHKARAKMRALLAKPAQAA